MLHQVRGLAQRMADKRENKPAKLSNVGTTKRKEILVSKTEQEIFQATKLVIETTSSKPLGLEVDQTSLALCLRFVSPWHYQEMFTKGRFYTGGKILTPKYQDMIQKYLTQ